MKPVLLDTGVIVALLDRSEKFHQACAAAVQELEAPLVTCEAVIAESCYLLRNLPGAPEAVIENVAAGIFQVPFQLSREAVGVKQVLRKYRDRRIDLAGACLIRLPEVAARLAQAERAGRLCKTPPPTHTVICGFCIRMPLRDRTEQADFFLPITPVKGSACAERNLSSLCLHSGDLQVGVSYSTFNVQPSTQPLSSFPIGSL